MKIIETIATWKNDTIHHEFLEKQEFFNEKNALIKILEYHPSENLEFETLHEYDLDNNLIRTRKIYHHPMCLNPNTVVEYENGKIRKEIEEWKRGFRTTVFYYENDLLYRKEIIKDDKIIGHTIINYLPNKAKEELIYENDELKTKIEFFYDSQNRLLDQITTTYQNGVAQDVETEEYRFLNDKLKELSWFENGELDLIERTHFDEKGREIKTEDGEIENNQLLVNRYIEKEWDSMDRMIKEKTVYEGKTIYSLETFFLSNGLIEETEWHEELRDFPNLTIKRTQKEKTT